MKSFLRILLHPLKQYRAMLLAAALGVMLTCAFAPFAVYPLAILALAGLLGLTLNTTPKQAFYIGLVFGIAEFLSGIYWVFIAIHSYGDVPGWLALFLTLLLSTYMALYPALTCFFAVRYFPTQLTARLLFAFPAIWVLLEYVRSFFLTGFPWLLIGYSQTNSPLKGYAPFLSVYGVSLALMITAGLLVKVVLHYQQKHYAKLYISIFAIITIWVLGGLSCVIPWSIPQGRQLPVSLVQGNIPQSLKWDPTQLDLSLQRYYSLTQPLWQKNRIIVWPEAAIPLSLQEASDYIQKLDEQALASSAHLILGIPIQNPANNSYFNAIIALGADKMTYVKRLLVPFGEYTPFRNISARLFKLLDVPMSDMEAGSATQQPFAMDGIKILPSVCFEIAFPSLMWTQDESINVLLTVTNNAWFGASTEQAQLLQMGQMRAIELARPLLMASNNGITAIINEKGLVESAAPERVDFVLNGTVQPMQGMTPWMRNGIDPILFIAFALLGYAVFLKKRKHALLAKK